MALIRTIADARKYVKLVNVSSDSILPDIEGKEMLYIVPIIGTALYNKLNTDFASLNTGGTDAYSVLLRHVQRTVGNIAYADELATFQTQITDNGVRTAETPNMTAAHSWEFKALRDDLQKKAAMGMELMIRHLFQAKASLPEWTASAEYKALDALAIRDATDFSHYFKLFDPYRTFWILQPIILDVQERYIVPTIGREMLKWLKGRTDALITVDNNEVDMMVPFKKAIAHFTIKHAMAQQAVRMDGNGFTILASGNAEETGSGRANSGLANLQLQRDELESMGQNYLKDLARYMKGAYAGDFTNDFSTDFDTAFELSPLLPANTTTPVLVTNNGNRKGIFVAGL
jgi:hypothetical protein